MPFSADGRGEEVCCPVLGSGFQVRPVVTTLSRRFNSSPTMRERNSGAAERVRLFEDSEGINDEAPHIQHP
jgi:hypothetical protein